MDGGRAFVHDSRDGFRPIVDGDVEACGEEFIAGATSNDAIGEVARDEFYGDHRGAIHFDVFDEELVDPEDFDRADFLLRT